MLVNIMITVNIVNTMNIVHRVHRVHILSILYVECKLILCVMYAKCVYNVLSMNLSVENVTLNFSFDNCVTVLTPKSQNLTLLSSSPFFPVR